MKGKPLASVAYHLDKTQYKTMSQKHSHIETLQFFESSNFHTRHQCDNFLKYANCFGFFFNSENVYPNHLNVWLIYGKENHPKQ